jgi:hypothetical protein
MSRATIEDILDRIKKLPEEDRRLLDEFLAEQEDQESCCFPRRTIRRSISLSSSLC